MIKTFDYSIWRGGGDGEGEILPHLQMLRPDKSGLQHDSTQNPSYSPLAKGRDGKRGRGVKEIPPHSYLFLQDEPTRGEKIPGEKGAGSLPPHPEILRHSVPPE
jgi:hypothetical protein